MRGRPIQVVGYQNLNELHHMIRSVSYIAKQEEVEDLPERIYQTKEVTLGPKARKAYNSVVQEVITALDSGQITIEQAITRSVKLRQITGGAVKNDAGQIMVLGNEKIDELMSVLNQIGNKQALIWCQFTHEIDRISERLKDINHAVYDGREKAKDRDQSVSDFEAGKIQVLILQNDAGYRALTLNAASYCIVFSNPEKLDVRVQLEKRAHRIGQKKNLIVIDLVVPGSIDKTIIESHAFKQDVADYVMEGKGDVERTKSVKRRMLRTL